VTAPQSAGAPNRAAQINGLRDLVAFLDARPEVPVPEEITACIAVPGGAQGDQEMMLAARGMGAALRIAPDGTTSAVKVFGPVRLRVVRLAGPGPAPDERRRARTAAFDPPLGGRR
jgi:hypothetical protein